MSNFLLRLILLVLLIHSPFLIATPNTFIHPEDPLEKCLKSFELEISAVEKRYSIILYRFDKQLFRLKDDMSKKNSDENTIQLLVKYLQISDSMDTIRKIRNADINKVRYIKGLEIIKILYEKTLALDHHFTTVSTLHDMQKMSNPNNYQEFTVAKSSFMNKTDKKRGFDLSAILGDNIYITIIHSMISLFSNEGINKSSKREMMDNIECILDFTLRTNNDLNTVYFESAYLKKNNEEIIQQIEELFMIYTQPIKYQVTLKKCRDNDDWLSIHKNLGAYINRLNYLTSSNQSSIEANDMQIDLEFAIDRLTHFIFQYNMFINQSGKFYEKFAIMLDSYENQEHCSTKIPDEYLTLKENINIAIDKFHNTYKPVEITGSKMKQLLYGLSRYH